MIDGKMDHRLLHSFSTFPTLMVLTSPGTDQQSRLAWCTG